MNGQYAEDEPHQEIQLTVRFRIKHNPATREHLLSLVEHYFQPKGIVCKEGIIEI